MVRILLIFTLWLAYCWKIGYCTSLYGNETQFLSSKHDNHLQWVSKGLRGTRNDCISNKTCHISAQKETRHFAIQRHVTSSARDQNQWKPRKEKDGRCTSPSLAGRVCCSHGILVFLHWYDCNVEPQTRHSWPEIQGPQETRVPKTRLKSRR